MPLSKCFIRGGEAGGERAGEERKAKREIQLPQENTCGPLSQCQHQHTAKLNSPCLTVVFESIQLSVCAYRNVRDCFQKPLKGSIHNRGVCTLSEAGWKTTTIYSFTFEKAKKIQILPRNQSPSLSFFVFCHIPSPTSHPISCLFIYFFQRRPLQIKKEKRQGGF